jgi:hypothetical protein
MNQMPNPSIEATGASLMPRLARHVKPWAAHVNPH